MALTGSFVVKRSLSQVRVRVVNGGWQMARCGVPASATHGTRSYRERLHRTSTSTVTLHALSATPNRPMTDELTLLYLTSTHLHSPHHLLYFPTPSRAVSAP